MRGLTKRRIVDKNGKHTSVWVKTSKEGKGFVFSHTFNYESGNKVTQYNVSDNIGGYARVEEYSDGFVITNVIMGSEGRRKGYATKLYEKANKDSIKKTGKTLQSIKPDENGLIELSEDGKALWESFVRKGKAKKITTDRYRFNATGDKRSASVGLTMRQGKLWSFVERQHEEQKRKYTGDPYTVHLTAVAEKAAKHVKGTKEIGMCHDLFEDTTCTREDLAGQLIHSGYDKKEAERIVNGVQELTDVYTHEAFPDLNRKQRKQKEAERLGTISPLAQSVKYADLLDNTKSIVEHDLKFARVYVAEKREILKHMNKGNKELYAEVKRSLANAEKEIYKEFIGKRIKFKTEDGKEHVGVADRILFNDLLNHFQVTLKPRFAVRHVDPLTIKLSPQRPPIFD